MEKLGTLLLGLLNIGVGLSPGGKGCLRFRVHWGGFHFEICVGYCPADKPVRVITRRPRVPKEPELPLVDGDHRLTGVALS